MTDRIRRTVLLSILMLLAFAHTALAAPGSIAGTVLKSDATPAAGVFVTALVPVYEPEFDFEYYEWAGEAVTNAAGGYTITGLPADSYVVEFWDPTENHITEYFDGAMTIEQATPVSVTSGGTRTGVNATLVRASHVTGRVTGPTGAGLPDIDVFAWLFDAAENEWLPMYGAFTDADGYYDIGGLPAGLYRISFEDYEGNWTTEYYNDAPMIEQGTTIAVGSGVSVGGINATLAAASHISGRVTDPSGFGVAEIEVTAFRFDTGSSEWLPVWGSYTDAGGYYDIGGLSAGTYRVEFWDPYEDWATEYYNDRDDVSSANDIAVDASATVRNINAVLSPWGAISGKVTNSLGQALKSITVKLWRWEPSTSAWIVETTTATGSDGMYSLAGLSYGTYRVEFIDPAAVWESRYWLDSGASGVASDIVLSRTSLSKTAHTVLSPMPIKPATVAGTIKSSTGTPLAGMNVTLYDEYTYTIATTTSAANGTYTFGSVPPGNYKIRSVDPARRYVRQWWGAPVGSESYGVFTLKSGEYRSGVDVPMTRGGTIAGRVVDEVTGAPIDGIHVTCARVESVNVLGFRDSVKTSPDGTYLLGGLPSGTYRISFWDGAGNYMYEAYDNFHPSDPTGMLYEGSTVQVTAPNQVTNINARLQKSLSISGTVMGLRDGSTAQVQLWQFRTSDNTWQPAGGWSTTNTGYYRINDLHPGSYRVEFRVSPIQFYPNWPTLDGALDIILTDSSIMGIDAKFAPGSTISGRITQDNGSAVAGARVTAFRQRPGGWEWVPVASTTAGPDGAYRLGTGSTLLASAYRVAAESDAHAGRFWPTADSAATADVINLPAGTSRDGVDIRLAPRATLSHERLDGADRFDTAARASAAAFPSGAPVVVLTTGENWPDALGGNALAAALGGPLLLTQRDALPASVSAEISRLGATRIVLLGGDAAVSSRIERELARRSGITSVRRVAGSNRYETAQRVAAEVIAAQGAAYDGHAVIVTGADFPDALAASPVAAANGWPVYLLSKPKMHSGELRSTISDQVESAVIVGGSNAIAWSTQSTLTNLLGPFKATRVAGANRFDTSARVAEYGCTYGGLNWRDVAVATGERFPDALAAGSLQANRGSVLMLTPSTHLHADVATTLTRNKAYVSRVTYLGGPKAVSENVRSAVAQALK